MNKTEKEFSNELVAFFDSQHWEYQREYKTKSGKYIDFLVTVDGITFGVECKKNLDEHTPYKDYVKHYEQASAYAKDLGVPVFIGPVYTEHGLSGVAGGGKAVPSINAFLLFGGITNVGAIFKRAPRWGSNYWRPETWFMVLRSKYFWNEADKFNEKMLCIVTSTGSKRERTPLNRVESNPFNSPEWN